MKQKTFLVWAVIFSSTLFSMHIERNYEDRGQDAITLLIHSDLYWPLARRLYNHTMVDRVQYPGAYAFLKDMMPVTILLKREAQVAASIINRESFRRVLLGNYLQVPLSKNAKRKLKNILHAFIELSEYRDRNHLRGDDTVGFYPMDEWKQCFIPDLVDYFAGMEENTYCCLEIARMKRLKK